MLLKPRKQQPYKVDIIVPTLQRQTLVLGEANEIATDLRAVSMRDVRYEARAKECYHRAA